MPTPSSTKAPRAEGTPRALRQHIVEVALTIVARDGVKALTQPRVAREAGIRASHLTYYYPRKADLLAAVLEASHARGNASDAPITDELRELVGDGERMRVFLASVVEACSDPTLAKTLGAHMQGFEARVASAYGRAPHDARVSAFVDELRGAGLRQLFRGPAVSDVAEIARRHGLGSPLVSAEKSFGDPGAYAADIEQVLPGHRLARDLALAALAHEARSSGALLVSGCGPGDELVEAARLLPSWRIDGVDPSNEMRERALKLVTDAGLQERVGIHPQQPRRRWDAGLSLFVAHLLDGATREMYWAGLGRAIRPGGILVVAEIERVTESELHVWQTWARARGASDLRVSELAQRLRGGFSTLPFDETRRLAEMAGLTAPSLILRALGVTVYTWLREGGKGTKADARSATGTSRRSAATSRKTRRRA